MDAKALPFHQLSRKQKGTEEKTAESSAELRELPQGENPRWPGSLMPTVRPGLRRDRRRPLCVRVHPSSVHSGREPDTSCTCLELNAEGKDPWSILAVESHSVGSQRNGQSLLPGAGVHERGPHHSGALAVEGGLVQAPGGREAGPRRLGPCAPPHRALHRGPPSAPSLPSSPCPARAPLDPALQLGSGSPSPVAWGCPVQRHHWLRCCHSQLCCQNSAEGSGVPVCPRPGQRCGGGGRALPSTGPGLCARGSTPSGGPTPPPLHRRHRPTPGPRLPTQRPSREPTCPHSGLCLHGVALVASLTCPQRPERDLQNITGK
ncbi:uncharacterized protein LOC104870191 [Fukomys damarensis]|uniref:uncharacterized protein LOC104870190 n=1 Tax=Fukomys damarensis TaxID=885580 RepID=UPI00053FAC35|nr:uncharacterized protein LOC104870190 [Fukomys damarensis]XP_010633935.1 uncharacterized protein LOC104870191 [Fukomys damarensis]